MVETKKEEIKKLKEKIKKLKQKKIKETKKNPIKRKSKHYKNQIETIQPPNIKSSNIS